MSRFIIAWVIVCISAIAYPSIAQQLYPSAIVFGAAVGEVKASLAHQCDSLAIHTRPKVWSVATHSQLELVCEGYFYWGKKRSLHLEFNDDQLDVVRLSGIRNALVEIINRLGQTYGEPNANTDNRFVLYFEKGAVALEPAKDQLTFVSPRLKTDFAKLIEHIKDHPLNLQLSREEWLNDLEVLDSRIRNAHLNPFWHNSESGYLDVFYQAQHYIATTEKLDKNVINGFFQKLVAYMADGHSYIANKVARFDIYPYRLDWVGDDLVVVEIDKKYPHLLGAKVIAFSHYSLTQANVLIKPFVPVINVSGFKDESKDAYSLAGLLMAAGISKNNNSIELSLKTLDGKTVKQTFIAESKSKHKTQWVSLFDNSNQKLPYYLQTREKLQWIVYLEKEQALYVRYAGVGEKNKGDIRDIANQIIYRVNTQDVKKLIIDVRNNGGGDSYLNAPLINAIANSSKINQRGKLFVLTNHATFSAAINFVGNMAVKTRALFVGEQVRDSATFIGEAGPQALYELPNSHIAVSLSFSQWNTTYDNDNRESPSLDLPVTAHIEDILRGQDTVLQTALNYKSEPKPVAQVHSSQESRWIGRYDFSPDKALIIKEEQGALVLEISELVFSDLYLANNNELTTDLSGVRLKLSENGDIEFIQPGSSARTLKKLSHNQLKPVELLVSGRFDEAKAGYQKIFTGYPELLSIRGNSLGILASHLRARYQKPLLFDQLHEIAISLYGSPILSWEDDE